MHRDEISNPNTDISANQCCVYAEFCFKQAGHAFTAFKNIGRGISIFGIQDGLEFGRMLGVGSGNGFSILPDFKRYAVFTVWRNQQAAKNFVEGNEALAWYLERSTSSLLCHLAPIKSHGFWSGGNPFRESIQYTGGALAVVTRATIRPSRLHEFWRNVPSVSRQMTGEPSMLYSAGIGEYPLLMQATFSIWEDMGKLAAAAYKSSAHGPVVKKTRERQWYKEELFARFAVLSVQIRGTRYARLHTLTHQA